MASEKALKKSEVPAEVLKTVSAKYPKAAMTSFSQEIEDGKTEFEVKLKNDGHVVEVSCSRDGTIVSEEEQITLKDVPEVVQKGLGASAFGKAKVRSIEKVTEAAEPNAPLYEFVILEGGKKHEVVFSAAGVLKENGGPKK